MKIQEASEDFTKGGIMFLSSKTSYIEANTLEGEEPSIFSTERTHKLPDTEGGARRP